MHKINSLGFAKAAIIGIFAILAVILIIPLLVLLSQQKQTSHSQTQTNPRTNQLLAGTPTSAATFSFSNEQGTITGYVYNDKNQDGQREEEEKPFENIKLQMKILKENGDDSTTLETKTDSYGYFSFHFPVSPSNSYMIKLTLPENYKTINTNPLIISDLKQNTQKIVEFGLTLSGDIEKTPSPTLNPKP